MYTAGNHQYAENILIPSREEKGGFSLGFVLEAVHLRALFLFRIICWILRNWGLKENV